jgi:hypothetical protein
LRNDDRFRQVAACLTSSFKRAASPMAASSVFTGFVGRSVPIDAVAALPDDRLRRTVELGQRYPGNQADVTSRQQFM